MAAEERIVVVGESHVLSIAAFWNQVRSTARGMSVVAKCFSDVVVEGRSLTVDDAAGAPRFHPLVERDLVDAGLLVSSPEGKMPGGAPPWVFLLIGGIACYHRLFTSRGDEDFALPRGFPGAHQLTGRLVPYDIVVKRARQDLASIFKGIELLAALLGDRLVVVPPPPPHRDNAQVERMLESVDGTSLGGVNRPLVTARPGARLKTQYVYQEALRTFCEGAHVAFHEVWDVAAAPDGFLDARFEFDGFHANVRHGGMVLLSLCDRFVQKTKRFDTINCPEDYEANEGELIDLIVRAG